MSIHALMIHQPHFLPWLGYFNKIAQSDVVVLQDNVQFRRGYFQNRTRISDPSGNCKWLTVPVRAKRSTILADVVEDGPFWRNKVIKRLHHCYSKTEFYKQFSGSLFDTIDGLEPKLSLINLQLLKWCCEQIKVTPEFQLASSLGLNEKNRANIAQICKLIGATHYIYGEGKGKERHPEAALLASGVQIMEQRFKMDYFNSIQVKSNVCPNPSIVDFLFRYGAAKTSELVKLNT